MRFAAVFVLFSLFPVVALTRVHTGKQILATFFYSFAKKDNLLLSSSSLNTC